MRGQGITYLVWIQSALIHLCFSKTLYLLRDVCQHNYGVVLSSTLTTSSLGCASVCETEQLCASVLFNPANNICVINKQTSQYIGPTGSCSTLVKYVAVLKRPCASNTDCTVPSYSECVDDICQCINGYSYSPTEGTCTSQCTTYGSTYRTFQGMGLTGLNNERLPGTSLEACLQLCSSDTYSFTCRSIDYSTPDSLCHLSSATSYTHPSAYTPGAGYLYIHRNCA